MAEQSSPSGPDLTKGVALTDLAGGRLFGHVGDDEVLLVRSGAEIFAIGAQCTHYHGPLAEGLVVGETRALPLASRLFRPAHRRGGARAGVQPGRVLDGRAARRPHLRAARSARSRNRAARRRRPMRREQIVIVGGGAAGFAAAEMLRRQRLSTAASSC